MADRYWVGGTANWDGTAGTRWATTSNGAGGQAVPTASDDVYFDASSGSGVITIPASTSVSCRSLTCTGYTGTLKFAATTSAMTIGTSTANPSGVALLISSGMTVTLTGVGTITISSTSGTSQTVLTNGKTMPNLTVTNSATTTCLLADAFTSSGTFSLTAGIFDTGNFNVQTNLLATSGAGTKVLTLGSSTWTISAGNSSISMAGTNQTLNAGTSTLKVNQTVNNPNFGTGLTWYDVLSDGAGNVAIGTLSCRNYTRTGTAVKTDTLSLQGNVTCSGAFICNGNSLTNRVYVKSSITGTTRTISSANNTTLSNCDFQDVTATGGGTWTGSSVGDALGNTGITFTTNTGTANGLGGVYRYGVVAGNWSSTATWSTTSGGGGGASVPLPHDTVILDASSAAGTYTADMPRVCADLIATNFTRTINASTAAAIYYGSFTLGAGLTFSATQSMTFAGRGTQTFTTAGKTVTNSIVIDAFGGTYTQQDAVTLGGQGTFNLSSGSWVTSDYALTCVTVTISGTNTRSLTLGTSTITASGTSTVWNATTTTGLTFSGASSTIVFSSVSATAKAFLGGGLTYGTFSYVVAGSTGSVSISGANYFDTLNIGSGRSLIFSSSVLNTVKNFIGTGSPNAYVYMNGTFSDGASSPTAAQNEITSDIDIRVDVALDSWSSGLTPISKDDGGTHREWQFAPGGAGKPTFTWWDSGGTQRTTTASVATGFAANSRQWLRVTLQANNGSGGHNVKFWTSPSGTPVWTQLGTTQSAGAFTTSIRNQTASVYVGSGGGAGATPGKYYAAQIRNNILDDGTGIVFNANFAAKAFGANTFTESSSFGATVTMNGLSQAGDGRVLVAASSSGTAAQLALHGPVDTLDYQTVQDIYSMVPYKYYAGANSVSISGNTNVVFTDPVTQPYITKAVTTSGTATSTTSTLPFSQTATAGNLLVVIWQATSTLATGMTGPSGFTLITNTNPVSTTANCYMWYKIAAGGETAVTVATTSTHTQTAINFMELAGFNGTPALDVSGKTNDSGSGVTSLATVSVTNTGNPAFAIGGWAHATTPGAFVSITNNWHWTKTTNINLTASYAAIPLSANAAQTTTLTWTNSVRSSSIVAVFKDVASAAHFLSLMGVGS